MIETEFWKVSEAYKATDKYKRVNTDLEISNDRPVFFAINRDGSWNSILNDKVYSKSFPNIYFSKFEELLIEDQFEKENYLNTYFWKISKSDVWLDD